MAKVVKANSIIISYKLYKAFSEKNKNKPFKHI